jgi:hypothetical protein
MTKVTRHPNCRCATHTGDNLYCPIHGRIRDMDAGASPFMNADAMGAEIASQLGIQEEDVDRTMPTGSISEHILQQDMLRAKLSIPPGCLCPHGIDLGTGSVLRTPHPNCPVHAGEQIPDDVGYIDSDAEEI